MHKKTNLKETIAIVWAMISAGMMAITAVGVVVLLPFFIIEIVIELITGNTTWISSFLRRAAVFVVPWWLVGIFWWLLGCLLGITKPLTKK